MDYSLVNLHLHKIALPRFCIDGDIIVTYPWTYSRYRLRAILFYIKIYSEYETV